MNDGYKVTDEDVGRIVNALKVFDPENANSTTARLLLEKIKGDVRDSLAELSVEEIIHCYSELDKN